MPLDTQEQKKIEVPPDWRIGALLNCPYYLTLKDCKYPFWDGVYMNLQRATGSWLRHRNQGPCRRPCETSGPTSSHDILLTRGTQADNEFLGTIINKLIESMPQIQVDWE